MTADASHIQDSNQIPNTGQSQVPTNPDGPFGTYVHIASFIVHCRPAYLPQVVERIPQLPLTEVTHRSDSGKLVVVAERGSARDITRLTETLTDLDGVLSVNMVYHQIELAHELEEVVSP